MPITDNKIASFPFNHKDQVDELYQIMDSTTVKNSFDSRSEKVRDAIHGLIDDLLAPTVGDCGADNIGVEPIAGLSGATIYEVLLSIKTALDAVVLGTIPDNSISNSKLVADIDIGSLTNLNTTTKSSIINAINEVLSLATTVGLALDSYIPSSQAVTVPSANKLLLLNAFSKLPASITGDSASVNSKTASQALSTIEKVDLAGAINEIFTSKLSSSQVTTTATANKVLQLNGSAKLPASITGDSATVGGKTANTALTTTQNADLAGAINEHDAEIGIVSTLTTSSKVLVGAINELRTTSTQDTEWTSGTGWKKFPNGLIVQWGTSVTGSDALSGTTYFYASGTCTFPISFPTACVMVNAIAGDNVQMFQSKTNFTTSSAVVSFTGGNNNTSGRAFNWLAIGY